MTIIVTGGAGFIGSNFIHKWISRNNELVINFDKLTYAGNLDNLDAVRNKPDYSFVKGDIGDSKLIFKILEQYRPRAVINFAAESHVDKSILSPQEFVETNIVGTFNLLEVIKNFFYSLNKTEKNSFRFLHVSTDEVYGSLEPSDLPFDELHPYRPNSPYSASKASSDHIVRAYFHTFGVPVITSNCSNNYGPFQFPEKLIPLCINNALSGKSLPIYGDGQQIRDWLFVEDHCDALCRILESGTPGEVYNIGGNNEVRNLDVVTEICSVLDLLTHSSGESSFSDQIVFVEDRKGHDARYAINSKKIQNELGWMPKETFRTGLVKTVKWYLENVDWLEKVSVRNRMDVEIKHDEA